MKINKDKDYFDQQSKKDLTRNKKSRQTPPLFTNFKSKIVSSSSIDMNKKRLTGISDPRLDVDPINFRYLKENVIPKTSVSNKAKSSTRFLPKSGGAMKGNINMSGNKVENLQTPTTNSSEDTAATVGYVQTRADKVSVDPEVIEKIKNLSDLAKELGVIEEALGIKPISPDTPPEEEEGEDLKNSIFVQHKGSCMTGCLRMHHCDLSGIPMPLDSEKDHAANVEYIQRKKRSLEVEIGEEEDNNNNNGGGTGGGSGGTIEGNGSGSASGDNWDEEYREDNDGNILFRLSHKNVRVDGTKFQENMPWAESNYSSALEVMKKVLYLHRNEPRDMLYRDAYTLIPGTFSYDFTFKIREGKVKLSFYKNSEQEIDFTNTKKLKGEIFLSNNVNIISIINISEGNKILSGTWDWEISLKVKKSDLTGWPWNP